MIAYYPRYTKSCQKQEEKHYTSTKKEGEI
jgi:hypothetical protein